MARGDLVDIERWKAFWEYWEDLIEEFPDVKKEALRAAGEAALEEVRAQIDRRGIRDTHGRVKRWQGVRMGSKGGYVAVSAIDETVSVTASGTTTAKDITRYLDKGHGIRRPSGLSKRYVPRMPGGRTYVPARQFYSWAKMNAVKIATEAADKALEQFSDAVDNARYGQ